MNRLLVPLCYSLLASPVAAQNGGVADHSRVKEAIHLLETWIEAQRAYDDIPGVSAAVVYDQDVLWAKGFGFANRAAQVPATPQTIYSICSISKLFTSVGVMQLRDMGHLRLDDPVGKHLDWFARLADKYSDAPPVTIQGILTHSAGLPRESDFPYWSPPDFPFPAREQIMDRLSEQERIKLQDDIRLFVGEKHWEGCGGLDLTDEIRVTISTQACLLVLGLDYELFDRVLSILVYPDSFRFPQTEASSDRDVDGGEPEICGLARYRGEVLLSWADIVEDIEHPEEGYSLVLHEFTHKLDARDGKFDGTPPLESREQALRWAEVMTGAYDGLRAAADREEETLLDPYGIKDEAEFLAVATECFFTRPSELRSQHPDLYGLLRDCFRQDPAARRRE